MPVQLVDGTKINGAPQEKVVPAVNLSTTLENLNRYTVYKIEVWGATVKGGGPTAMTFAGKMSFLFHCIFLRPLDLEQYRD